MAGADGMHAPAPTPRCILGLDALLLVPVKSPGARIKEPGASSRSAAAESLKRAEALPKRAALPGAGADLSNCSVNSDPVCNDALKRCISLQRWLFWPSAVVCTQWLYVSCQLYYSICIGVCQCLKKWQIIRNT